MEENKRPRWGIFPVTRASSLCVLPASRRFSGGLQTWKGEEIAKYLETSYTPDPASLRDVRPVAGGNPVVVTTGYHPGIPPGRMSATSQYLQSGLGSALEFRVYAVTPQVFHHVAVSPTAPKNEMQP
jgi:hypothetical protein